VEGKVNAQMNGERGHAPFAFKLKPRRKPQAAGSEQRNRIPDGQLFE